MGVEVGTVVKGAGFFAQLLKCFRSGPKVKVLSCSHHIFVSPPGYSGNCGTDASISLDAQVHALNAGEDTTFESVTCQKFDLAGHPVGEFLSGHISVSGGLGKNGNDFLRKNENRHLVAHFGWREERFIPRGPIRIDLKPVGQKPIQTWSMDGKTTISDFKDGELPKPSLPVA